MQTHTAEMLSEPEADESTPTKTSRHANREMAAGGSYSDVGDADRGGARLALCAVDEHAARGAVGAGRAAGAVDGGTGGGEHGKLDAL